MLLDNGPFFTAKDISAACVYNCEYDWRTLLITGALLQVKLRILPLSHLVKHKKLIQFQAQASVTQSAMSQRSCDVLGFVHMSMHSDRVSTKEWEKLSACGF